MNKVLKIHAVAYRRLTEENLMKHVGFVYAYEKKAKNRKIHDERSGDKQKKHDS